MKSFGLLVLLLASLAPQRGVAVEPQNPVTLCERFIAPDTKSNCEKKIKKMAPDWYLAGVCEKQFDDSEFWKCLDLSQTKNFSPVALEKCNAEGASDQDRLTCLKNLAQIESFQNGQSQGRQPASRRGKH